MRLKLSETSRRLAVAEGKLTAVSPLATLSRGYAIVRHESGRVVRQTKDVRPADKLAVQVLDGEFHVKVTEEEVR